MNKKDARLNRMLALLRGQETETVGNLAQYLAVSEMTVRRDLDELAREGCVRRFHGKAAFIKNREGYTDHMFDDIDSVYSLHTESEKRNDEKGRIAKKAASLVQPGDVLLVDNGSTTDLVADFLPRDMPLTVASYNLNVAMKLWMRENISLLLAGGYFYRSDMMFQSDEGVAFLKGIRATKLFLSASGVHLKLGMTCAHRFEVEVKQAAIDSALEKILLVDSSKFGTIKTAFFAPLDSVDTVITDSGLPDEWRSIFAEKGITLIVV